MSYDPALVGAFNPSAMYFPVVSVVLLGIAIGESPVITIVFEEAMDFVCTTWWDAGWRDN
jgi:hypothetical protein